VTPPEMEEKAGGRKARSSPPAAREGEEVLNEAIVVNEEELGEATKKTAREEGEMRGGKGRRLTCRSPDPYHL